MGKLAIKIVCASCKEQLTDDERIHSHGRCPKCNHRGTNALTTVDVIFVSVYVRAWYERLLPRRAA